MSVKHTIPRGRLAIRLVAVADDGSEHVPYKESGSESGLVSYYYQCVHDKGISVPSASLPLGRVPKHLTPAWSEDGRPGSFA